LIRNLLSLKLKYFQRFTSDGVSINIGGVEFYNNLLFREYLLKMIRLSVNQ
jgi:hypothetical protein